MALNLNANYEAVKANTYDSKLQRSIHHCYL